MEVLVLDDPVELLRRAGPLLMADEARHNLLLGLLATIRDEPGAYPEHSFWLVEDAGTSVGVALRTPPHNLVVARPRVPEALAVLAAAIADGLPGVTGARPEGDMFATAWSAVTGGHARIAFEQRIYALRRVRPARHAAGVAREAAPADRELLLAWLRAFAVEALHESAPDEQALARHVERRLAERDAGLLLWEVDGVAVSLAGWGGATPSGIRVGPVYTPPAHRGQGYAGALVAALSSRLLAAGRRFCFLYTDLANPASNRVYVRVGYEPVCDSVQYAFEP